MSDTARLELGLAAQLGFVTAQSLAAQARPTLGARLARLVRALAPTPPTPPYVPFDADAAPPNRALAPTAINATAPSDTAAPLVLSTARAGPINGGVPPSPQTTAPPPRPLASIAPPVGSGRLGLRVLLLSGGANTEEGSKEEEGLGALRGFLKEVTAPYHLHQHPASTGAHLGTSLHPPCTPLAPHLQAPCTHLPAPHARAIGACTASAPPLHRLCTASAPPLHRLCSGAPACLRRRRRAACRHRVPRPGPATGDLPAA